MVVPLKLVSLNTYLVSRHFNHNRITYPERRARRIRDFLQPYDLCFLQEVWGTAMNELTFSIPQSHGKDQDFLQDFQFPPRREAFPGTWLLGSTLSEIIHTAYLHFWQTGGLFDMSRGTTCSYRKKHTFTKSRSKSLKGVEATLWTNICAWDGKYDLLIFNTHLDPWIAENRKLQVSEIEHFMTTTVKDMGDEQRSRTGVLVVGDFNVKADNLNECEELFVKRQWKDLLEKVSIENELVDGRNDKRAHTYAQKNDLACCPDDYGRIDYIFAVDKIGDMDFLSLTSLCSQIPIQMAGEELSDHYPVTVELIPSVET